MVMQVIGFLILALVTIVVWGSFLWTTQILMRQKKAWEMFAKKYKLTYEKGQFFGSPAMVGAIGKYQVAYYSAQKPTTDVQGQRSVTVVEIGYPQGLVDGGAAGTEVMVPFMQTMNLLHPYNPKWQEWNKDFKMMVREDSEADGFWNQKRLQALQDILSAEKADVLFLYDDREALIRYETTDPLQDPNQIKKITERFFELSNTILDGHTDKKVTPKPDSATDLEEEDSPKEETPISEEELGKEDESSEEAPENTPESEDNSEDDKEKSSKQLDLDLPKE